MQCNDLLCDKIEMQDYYFLSRSEEECTQPNRGFQRTTQRRERVVELNKTGQHRRRKQKQKINQSNKIRIILSGKAAQAQQRTAAEVVLVRACCHSWDFLFVLPAATVLAWPGWLARVFLLREQQPAAQTRIDITCVGIQKTAPAAGSRGLFRGDEFLDPDSSQNPSVYSRWSILFYSTSTTYKYYCTCGWFNGFFERHVSDKCTYIYANCRILCFAFWSGEIETYTRHM